MGSKKALGKEGTEPGSLSGGTHPAPGVRAGSGRCPEPLKRRPRRLSPSASPAPGVSHLPSSPALTSGRGPWQPPGSRTPEGSRRAPGETSRPASVKGPPRPHSAPGMGTSSSRVQMGTLGRRSRPPSEVPGRTGFTLQPATFLKSPGPPPRSACRGAQQIPPKSPADANTPQPALPPRLWGCPGESAELPPPPNSQGLDHAPCPTGVPDPRRGSRHRKNLCRSPQSFH